MGTRALSVYGAEVASLSDATNSSSPSLEECLSQKGVFLALKRCCDVALSVIALIALLPIFAITALAIVVDDGGPIFYSQERVGLRGRVFRIYKFRSMRRDAERLHADLLDMNEADGPAFKMREDPRMTRVGRFIRKVSIDELPQLVNVIKGEMSLVGPRPLVLAEASRCSEWQNARLLVKPGLTCLWQVMPGRNSIPFDEWMQADIDYIRTCGVTADAIIIAKTFRAILNAEGW